MPASTNELVFAPLGGVGEIGMNLSVYGVGLPRKKAWLAVDLGVAFAGDDLPGIDLIMPDIRFLLEQRNNLLGLVLTHAHEDHYGALIDLWPRLKVPLYATPFTAALLEAKFLDCASRALTADAARALLTTLRSLEEAATIDSVTATMVPSSNLSRV